MTREPRFVTVTNQGVKPIILFSEFQVAERDLALKEEIRLRPGKKSKPMAYEMLTRAKNWKALSRKGLLQVEDVSFDPQFVAVENRSDKPLALEIQVPVHRGRKKNQPHKLRLAPGATSHPINAKSVKQNLKSLAAKGTVVLDPVTYIGPPAAGTWGSYGTESVYTCYKCGGPIVFRTNGRRHPVHI